MYSVFLLLKYFSFVKNKLQTFLILNLNLSMCADSSIDTKKNPETDRKGKKQREKDNGGQKRT